MKKGILLSGGLESKEVNFETNSRALYFAFFIPLACMLFLLEWEPRVFVFVFLAYSAGVIGFLLAKHFLKGDAYSMNQNRYFQLLAEHSNEILILHRMEDNSNVYISPSIKTQLDYSPDEILCKYGTFLIHPEDRKILVRHMNNLALRKNPIFTCTLRVKNKQEDYTWMEICGKAVQGEQGIILYTLLSLRDASERKEVESVTRQFAEELIRKNEEGANGSNSRLALMMGSHDLKEPLRTIGNYVQRIEEKYLDHFEDQDKENMFFINDGIKRMKGMLNDIFSLSSIEHGQTSMDLVHLSEVMKEVLSNLNQQICESGATISFEPLPEINVDRRQFKHLLQNLIQNGIKYCDNDHPFIQVSWIKSEGFWQFKFADNGIGIDPEFQHSIFEAFRRLHGIGQYEGTGLGLSICKQIVENHKGRIWVESEGKGKGSQFFFSLPIREDRNYASGFSQQFSKQHRLEEVN